MKSRLGSHGQLARQYAALERHARDDADIRLRRDRKDGLPGLLREQVVFHLDRLGASVFGGGDAFFHRIDRNAVVADFPRLLGAFEYVPNLAALDDVDRRIVQLIKIDVLGLQAL